MFNHIHQVVLALAPPTPTPAAPIGTPTAPVNINTEGIAAFLATTILPIVLLIIAVIVTSLAAGGRFSAVMTKIGIVVMGIFLFGSAAALPFFGKDIVHVLFTGF